ncbi:MAG TPA: deoxyhypusine synthase family protein, partial [Methanocella sp.]
AIQYTTDAPHWGGLSGCTFEEAVSWGKISGVAPKVQVFADATISLPIVSHALAEKTKSTIAERKAPQYDWSGKTLKVRFAASVPAIKAPAKKPAKVAKPARGAKVAPAPAKKRGRKPKK